MEQIWIKQYPPGTPTEIDSSEYPSLKALIETSCEQFASRTAYLLSARFAAWLQRRGLRKGDRIAIMLPNILQYPVVLFGALRAGLTVVSTNPLYTATELEHQLRDSGAAALVVLENFAAVAQLAIPGTSVRHIIVTGVGDLLSFPKGTLVNFVLKYVQRKVPAWHIPGAYALASLLKTAPDKPEPVELGHEDIAFLQYTGGTTGVAKGAMLTHGNMIANILQCRAWFQQVRLENTTYVCALPLYHIFSLTANCLLFTSLGGNGLLITNPRDFPGFVKELTRNPPMFFIGVNTLFNALMNTPGFSKLDFSKLVATVGGGMAVQRAVAERWEQVTGCTVTQGWGLTETSPAACVNPLVGVKFNGAVGLPLPSTEVSVRDDNGLEVGINDSGELCLRGPQVMRGYWQRPDETAKVMLPGGWLRTGDVGRVDERGYVFIEDRKKDMINVSGFKVFPNEVEDVVAQMPGVAEVAAVAQVDERAGEVVALYVVRKDPALTADAILAHCHKYLTGYKLPRHIYFRTELPKTNVGKILRRALKEGGSTQ
jgi:long-chain acyl-CoA synthetase